MTNIKAIRANIKLGDIEIEGYQMPNGEYKVSQQTFKNTLDSLIGNSTGKKYLKPILEASSSIVRGVKIDGYNRPIVMYGLETFSDVVAVYAQLGNQKAIAILVACVAESLERRFDTAFNIHRTEEERNQRFSIRFDGILSRNFWTDSIAEYLKTHEVSDNYKRWIFVTVSDTVNLALFGMKAKQVRDCYNLRDGDSIREVLPAKTLKLIDTIENAAATRVTQTDSEPKQAIKDVIHLLGVEPDENRL